MSSAVRAARATSASTSSMTPTPMSRRYGRSSGSSSRTTSPPIARRWGIAPTRPRSATFASPRPTSRASTARGRWARLTCTARTTPPSSCSPPRDTTSRATTRASPSSAIRATTCTCSPARWWSPSSGCTTGWSIAFATTSVAEQDLFEEARRAASWHYQHVILREFLPGLIGAQLTAELLDERPAAVSRRAGPLHPVRVRRRRLPLRPLPDPRPLSGQRALRPVPGVPRSHGLRPGPARAHRRLGPSDRC